MSSHSDESDKKTQLGCRIRESTDIRLRIMVVEDGYGSAIGQWIDELIMKEYDLRQEIKAHDETVAQSNETGTL